MLGGGYAGSSSRRASAIINPNNSQYQSSASLQPSPTSSTHDSLMPHSYSPNPSSSSHRYTTGASLAASTSNPQPSSESSRGTLMDLSNSSIGDRNSWNASPNRMLNHRGSGQHLSQQYHAQGLGGLNDLLPYAYTTSHPQHGSSSSTASNSQYLHSPSSSHRTPQGPPRTRGSMMGSSDTNYASSTANNSNNVWSQPASSTNRNSVMMDSQRNLNGDRTGYALRTSTNPGLASLRTSGLYGDLTGFGQSTNQAPHSLTTSSDQSRTTSGSKGQPSHRSRRANEGFRRVRDLDDLRPVIDKSTAAASGAAAIADGKAATAAAKTTTRRADPAGGFVSPLKALTAYLHHTYHLVNPAFFYELSFNPRRVLTKPSKPVQNDGHDNEDSDYILYVNDWLGTEEGHKYLILDILGQGTFGQVVKCQDMTTHEIVAVKVIKNKPAYFNQSMMEVTVLEMLNGNWDPNDEHHILRLKDTFIHAKHLCLVLELLSSNLYELIKQNSFRGLSTSLVRVFTAQLLDALTILNEARLIHCDLKPENILLKTLQTPSIKLVDFGSACHEKQTVYTYIQSRFYRSPEVLLGLPYSSAIDMWSLGCIAVELFLGLPLFPGTSEYNQVCRIVEMLGLPSQYMLESGKQTGEFFQVYSDEFGRKSYRLKSIDQYSKEHNVQEQPSKKYFQATTLPEIIRTYPMSRKGGKSADVQKEMANRNSFIDFVSGLLNMDPQERWTPQQARMHPFITGEKFVKPFRPAPALTTSTPATKAKASDAVKHPYGGLPQTSARPSGKSFQDAAAYNQHLAQQQAYNSAAARQSQPVMNNPYAREEAAAAKAQAHAQAQVQAQAAAAAAASQNSLSPHYDVRHSMAPSSSNYYMQQAGGRQRSDNRHSVIPPQLAKLGIDPSLGSGQNLTPIVNREDSLREWERRQNGLAPSSSKHRSYQQLDLLQQQAESSTWGQQWNSSTNSSFAVVVDSGRSSALPNPYETSPAPPPAAYSRGGYNTLPFDVYDSGMAQLMPPALTPVRIQDREKQKKDANYGGGM